MKTFSVILTTYNSAAHLKATLDSILHQKGVGQDFNIQLLIIDDCSTDQTISILEEYKLPYHSTKTNSGGPNTGRNIGLKMATGDFICIADHDDVWHENRLSILYPYLREFPIVTSGYTVVSRGKADHDVRICRPAESGTNYIRFGVNETFLNKLSKSKSGQQAYLGSIVYHGELKNILFEEKHGMVDFDWILRLFYGRFSIEICETLFTRFVTGENLSLNENYRLKDFAISLEAADEYKNEFPQHSAIARKRIHGSLGRYYYLVNRMPEARKFFLKSEWEWKTLLYFLTTFAGSSFVRKRFKVFG